jgi:hypothetical protein
MALVWLSVGYQLALGGFEMALGWLCVALLWLCVALSGLCPEANLSISVHLWFNPFNCRLQLDAIRQTAFQERIFGI